MALADGGAPRRGRAPAGQPPLAGLGARVGDALRDWIAHNQEPGRAAPATRPWSASRTHGATPAWRWRLALILSGGLGLLTFRQDRGSGARPAGLGGVHRGRRLRRRRCRSPARADETGALARSIDVLRRGAGGHGGPALGQVERGHAHRRAAGGRDPRRVRRAAALGPGAGARRRRGGLLRPGARRDAPAADRPLRPGGVRPDPGVDRASGRGSSASARARASRCTSPACLRTTCASPRAWARRRRRRRRPGRSRRATRCWP